MISFFVRLLELLFVIGAIGCISSVIPITAYRLFMVLFEAESPAQEARFATQAQRTQSLPVSPAAKAAAANHAAVMAQTEPGKSTPPSSPVLNTR